MPIDTIITDNTTNIHPIDIAIRDSKNLNNATARTASAEAVRIKDNSVRSFE
jgi:hypothetical protein